MYLYHLLCKIYYFQVTYKNGVYNITDFVESHPGGDKILLAAGSSLEPYFELFGIHKTKEVMEIVEVIVTYPAYCQIVLLLYFKYLLACLFDRDLLFYTS